MGDSSLKNYTFTVDVKGLDGFMNGFKQPLLLFHAIHWQTSFSIILLLHIDLVLFLQIPVKEPVNGYLKSLLR